MYGVTRRYVDAGEIVNDIKDAYSMNWSIQKMLTADEYGEYVAAVEGYSERKLKGKAFYFSRITMCDAAYILAVKNMISQVWSSIWMRFVSVFRR